jgi:spermidine synthase
MILFAINIFLSAFLLFQIQPLIGKFILPWFGGTPAVWSTAMLFFQALLTGGYAYSYWLVKQTKQRWIHAFLLILTLALLTTLGLVWRSPITPSPDLRPAYVEFPVFNIFFILLASVGLPYFVLASNSPLMQAWFSRLQPTSSYARLYALSNVGSLLGLLAYPVLVEPNLSLQTQGWSWSIGFVSFALISFFIVYQLGDKKIETTPIEKTAKAPTSLKLLWMILGGVASLFLLSITNQITQEVTVIPFLWVLPLAIYLLSFILAFSDSRWYNRNLYALLFGLASLATLWALTERQNLPIIYQVSIYCLLLFFSCMICHGELYQLRPPAEQLTTFYLMSSLGGAFGGVFVNFVAPALFNGYWEFYLGWLMTMLILVIRLFPKWVGEYKKQTQAVALSFIIGTLLMLGLNQGGEQLSADRNFYGVVRTIELDDNTLAMIHGITIHGIQYKDKPTEPTTYFTPDSGVGVLLANYPKNNQPAKVAILGLGIVTLAAYGETGDDYRLYEINQIAIDLAEGEGGYFSFLEDSQANIEVIAGDARISLENEYSANGSHNFDVIVLDTFSSDSVPVHLVTKQAFDLYLANLKPDGVIAANISNQHIDLQPVFYQIAQEFGLMIIRIDNIPNEPNEYLSIWMLMTKNPESLNIPELQARAITYETYSTDVALFTDDYSNLFQILR